MNNEVFAIIDAWFSKALSEEESKKVEEEFFFWLAIKSKKYEEFQKWYGEKEAPTETRCDYIEIEIEQ